MNVLKVVGGAAAGVGSIALLPVFGPMLTVTAAGVAVGALLGGGGALASTIFAGETPATDPKAADEESLKRAEMAARLDRLSECLRSHKAQESHVLALFAMGCAAAWCDGPPDADDWEELKQSLLGLTWENYSNGLQAQLQGFYDAPPSLQQALAFVDSDDESLHDRIDDAVELAIALDDCETAGESAFREAWRRWRSELAA
jgi:hypothetical protein